MKILQITGMRSTKFGGLEKYFLEMAIYLSKRGDTMILQYNEEPLSNEYRALLKEYGIGVIVSELNKCSKTNQVLRLHKIIKEIEPDVIHFHFGNVASNFFFLPKLMGVKKCYRSIHSLPFSENKISIFSKIRFRLFALFNDKLVAVSNAIKKQIEAAIGENSKTILHYSGTNINPIQKGEIEKDNNIRISCIAFHNKVKGIDVLINALYILKHKYNFKEFILIEIGGGNDDYKKELENLVDNLKLNKNVQFYGLCNNVPELLSTTDIYVQPSRYEGIGIALMEAAVQGLPLIGSNIGGIPEIISDKENGFLFAPCKSEELAEKLYLLCSDKELRDKMGACAKETIIEKFDIKKNVELLAEDLYK